MATYIIEPSSSGPAERLAVMLQDLGHRLIFIRPHDGDAVPTESGDIDALVIMGGPGSAASDEPWIEATKSLVRTLDAAAMDALYLRTNVRHPFPSPWSAIAASAGQNPQAQYQQN